jgi:hypothetical protein
MKTKVVINPLLPPADLKVFRKVIQELLLIENLIQNIFSFHHLFFIP